MILKLSLLFILLIISGFFATLFLFKFNWNKIQERELDKKIFMWAPFALLFLVVFYIGYIAKTLFLIFLVTMSLKEFYKNKIFTKSKFFAVAYSTLFILGLLHMALYGKFFSNGTLIVITVLISTVLADVFAFFLGTFSKYKLPEVLNSSKSYMGVLGQVVGATFGVIILERYITGVVAPDKLVIITSIAIGAIIGDLYNSYTKRKLGIKDWSKSIPGHGGYVDRFCSTSFAMMITFYFLIFLS